MSKVLDIIKRKIISASTFVLVFFKWILVASVTGVICGIIGAAFDKSVDFVSEQFSRHYWFIFILPVSALAIVGLYKLCKVEMNVGTNHVISSIRTTEKVPALLIPLIFVSTVLTHLGGGSAGREGAALQIGGAIGNQFGRLIKLKEKDLHLITLCGMSGLFAALFGTPLTATIFAIEVISIGVIYYSALVPCITSSLTAYAITKMLGVSAVRFKLAEVPKLGAVSIIQIVILAAICAAVSIVFCFSLHGTQKLFKKYIKNEFLRILSGALIIVVLTLIFKSRTYNGTGMGIIKTAIEEGKARPYDFIMKTIFTAITIGCGLKGGEMVPTFFVGATLGCVVGGLIGMNPAFAAAIGFIALFCAVMNCPIASLVLSIEVFGAGGIIFFAIACAVSYLLSGYYGLYTSQKIVYSKLTAEYINKDTKPM